MKNVNYIINGVLAVAVVILFILHFSGKNGVAESGVQSDASEGSPISDMPIAYVNVDSLLLNYDYAKDLTELQMKSHENARLNLNTKGRELEKEAAEFQRKLNNNAFLTQERAEQEYQRIQKKNQDLQEQEQRAAMELESERIRMSETLRDTLVAQLKIFNQDKGYKVILSNTGGDNILLADDVYDITSELIKQMNKNYSPGK
ncbi:outer membrane protein [Parabacteroides sp. PFB2-10]|uniref:OmpH family outer membrane protein n=1 Tax=Parabacteroides sp. PFB2-10 TaxID=1742405 RepID=UPI002472FA5F|nr:OmpH family outer membrane protein [Parabacteroides sp. PFB2-10]MDH6311315.1 outer membrane protein [Parabacteroides sp. PFB2-10]MDL2244697.1 OmpH family outer membrane protein [Parabacteroides sp. OttesenSCG-928-J18]